MNPVDNLRGILFMSAGFAAFSCCDIMAKILTESYHPVQIAWTRQFGISMLALWFLFSRGFGLLRSVAPGTQVLRGLCAVVSALSFIVAISYVPLADAVAVTFVAPFMVTILGAALLKEPVGFRRWAAVIVGFIGTLIIIRPGLGVFHPAILIIFLAALVFAMRQIISRRIGKRDPTLTTLAYTALTSFGVLIPALVFVWTTPRNTTDLALMIGMTLFSGLGEFLIIKALEIAFAVVVAPLQYTQIVYASLLGYLVYGHFPDRWTWIGILIVVASGLYVIYREHRRKSQLIGAE